VPSLDLDGSPHSPRDSRRFVSETAQAWGVRGDQLDVARLLATELVTNAMLHGAPPIRISASRTSDVVRIEVSDASPQRPVPRPYDTDAPTGHGILLVERLARRWGIEAQHDGKTVWFEVTLSASNGTDATFASESAMQP
jgi:anti-sigma regulatory factor (Ser/Thr protein kinase)